MPDPKKVNKRSSRAEDWRVLADKASKEQDPHKLLKLVEELCARFDLRDAERKSQPRPMP